MKLRLVKRGENDDKKERKRSSSNQNQLRNQSTRSRNDSVISGSSQLPQKQQLMHQSSQQQLMHQSSQQQLIHQSSSQQLIQSPSQIISQSNTTPNNMQSRDINRFQQQQQQQQQVKGQQFNQFSQWDQRNQENYVQHEDSTTERGLSNNERNSMGSSSTSSNKMSQKILAPRESNCASYSMNQGKSEDQRRLEMEFTKAQEEIHRLRDVCEQLMKEAQERMQYEEQVHNLQQENQFMAQQISDLQEQKSNQIAMFRQKLQDNEQQLKRNIQEELVKLGSTFAKDRENLEKANAELHEEREDILRRNNDLEQLCSQLQQKYSELEINYNQQHKNIEELWHENEDLRVQILKQQDQFQEVNNQGDNDSKEMYIRMCQLENELTYIQGELARVQAENANLERVSRETIEKNKIQTQNVSSSNQLNELMQELKREQAQNVAQRELNEEMKQQIDNLETLIKTLAGQAKEKQRRNVFLEQSVKTLQSKLAPKLSILKKTFRLLMCDMHLKHLLKTERQQHEERINELKVLFQQSETHHKQTDNQFVRLTYDYSELSRKSQEFEQQIMQQRSRTEEAEKIIQLKETEVSDLKKEIEKLSNQNSRFNETISSSAGNEQLNNEIKTLNREIDLLQANNTDLLQQLRWEKVGKESQTQQLIMNNSDIKSLQGQIEQFVTEISQLHIKEMQQTQEIEVLKQKIENLQQQQQEQLSMQNINNNSSCMKDGGQNNTATNNNNVNHICSLQLFNMQSENTLNTNYNNLNNNSNNFVHSKYENEECNIIKYSNKLNNLDNGIYTQSDISPSFNQKNYNQVDEIHRLSSLNYTQGQEILGLKAQLELSEGSLSSLKAQIVLVTSDNQILANRIKDLQNSQFADGNNSYSLKSKLDKEISEKRILQEEILQLQRNKKLVEEEVDKNTQDWSNKVKVLAQNFAIEKQSLEDRIKWYQINGGKLWN